MTEDNFDITVILAALNEEEGIGPTLRELREVLRDARILVVDGDSIDRTVEIAKSLGADVHVNRGRGKGRAISEALEYVNTNTRYLVFIDADFTYPACHIPEMVKILDSDPEVGMIVGNRFNSIFDIKDRMPNAYQLGNRLLALAHRVASRVAMKDPLSGLRVIRWGLIKDWKPISEGFDIEAELNFYVAKKGYQIMEIPIEYRPRLGRKKLGLRHGFTILKRILIETLT